MLCQESTNLGASFKEYFEIVPAFSNQLKKEAYRIRHQVYCEELKFEHVQPEGLEIDEYDQHSLHLLIRSTRTKTFIGCTRIILTKKDNPDHPLPFEKNCAGVIDRSVIDPLKLPRDTIAEVSRLTVISNFRRRKGEKDRPYCLSDEDYGGSLQLQPRFPYIPLSLYLGTTALASLNNIKTVFVLTEKRLANHLNKLGFGLRFIGEPIDHRGERVPSMISVQGVINGMKPTLRPLYNTIVADIERSLEPDTTKNKEVISPKYQKLSLINLHA